MKHRTRIFPPPAHDDLAGVLRQRMNRTGLSRTAIAEAIGVSVPTISRFSRGLCDLQLSTASRLCRLLDLRLTGKKIPPPQHEESEPWPPSENAEPDTPYDWDSLPTEPS